jgi:hypothetical protein
MRALALLALLLPAAGDDAFLAFLPDDVVVTLRLPPQSALEADAESYRSLLGALGRSGSPASLFYGSETPGGLDPARAPGLAIGASGGVVRYLPAKEKAILARALADAVGRGASYREEGDWVFLGEGGRGAGNARGEALPEGAMAIRVQGHRALGHLLHPLDRLEAGLRPTPNGFEFEGRLLAAANGSTADVLSEPLGSGGQGLVDCLAPTFFLRAEMALHPVALARPLATRIAAHAKLVDAKERAAVERLLREALTALDPATGVAIGLEFKAGQASLVLLGKEATGPPSPILNRIAQGGAQAVGPVRFASGETKPGVLPLLVWLAGEAEFAAEGLPDSFAALGAGLSDGDRPLDLCVRRSKEGWIAAGAGPRGALLAGDALRRATQGSARSASTEALRELRSGPGYVGGIVLAGAGLLEAAETDRAALRGWFGATESASAPAYVAVAAFAADRGLTLRGRVAWAR